MVWRKNDATYPVPQQPVEHAEFFPAALLERREPEIEIHQTSSFGVRQVGMSVKNSSGLEPRASAGNLRAHLIRARFHVREFEIALLVSDHCGHHGAGGEWGSVWSSGFSRSGAGTFRARWSCGHSAGSASPYHSRFLRIRECPVKALGQLGAGSESEAVGGELADCDKQVTKLGWVHRERILTRGVGGEAALHAVHLSKVDARASQQVARDIGDFPRHDHRQYGVCDGGLAHELTVVGSRRGVASGI